MSRAHVCPLVTSLLPSSVSGVGRSSAGLSWRYLGTPSTPTGRGAEHAGGRGWLSVLGGAARVQSDAEGPPASSGGHLCADRPLVPSAGSRWCREDRW